MTRCVASGAGVAKADRLSLDGAAEVGRLPRDRGARAFTLIEILLVLALLVVTVAIVWPGLARVQARSRLQQAAASVRSRLAEMHLDAVRHMQSYEFRYTPGRSQFRIACLESKAARLQSQSRPDRNVEAELPPGFRFDELPDSLTRRPHVRPGGSDVQNVAEWSQPIVFFPDGTASDAEFAVTDPRGNALVISVRRLTSSVRVRSGGRLP